MKKLLAALLAVLMLAAPASVWAVTLTSDAGERLSGEDIVTFTVTATADAATATDASLRIRLSDDLTLIDGSVRIASPTSAQVIGVVPGSDGFVVLMDSLTAGDTIVFEARLTGTEQSDVSCDAIQGTGESAQLSYVNAAYAPPTATATSAPVAVENTAETAAAPTKAVPLSGTAIAAACGAGVVIIGSVTYFALIRKRLFAKSAGEEEPADASDGDDTDDKNDTDGDTKQ